MTKPKERNWTGHKKDHSKVDQTQLEGSADIELLEQKENEWRCQKDGLEGADGE